MHENYIIYDYMQSHSPVTNAVVPIELWKHFNINGRICFRNLADHNVAVPFITPINVKINETEPNMACVEWKCGRPVVSRNIYSIIIPPMANTEPMLIKIQCNRVFVFEVWNCDQPFAE